MSILTIALLSAGLLLCVVEVFVPKIGLMGFLGIALLGLGFSSYYIDGFEVKYIIGLLGIVTIILSIFIMIELILESKGIIKNPNRYKLRSYNDNVIHLQSLVGQKGKAVTNIDLGGTIEIGGNLYYATSTSGIVKGSAVEVIGIKNNTLIVK
jgi:membrane-bound ClpP family serine protease